MKKISEEQLDMLDELEAEKPKLTNIVPMQSKYPVAATVDCIRQSVKALSVRQQEVAAELSNALESRKRIKRQMAEIEEKLAELEKLDENFRLSIVSLNDQNVALSDVMDKSSVHCIELSKAQNTRDGNTSAVESVVER